jgi:hypothetical protein
LFFYCKENFLGIAQKSVLPCLNLKDPKKMEHKFSPKILPPRVKQAYPGRKINQKFSWDSQKQKLAA